MSVTPAELSEKVDALTAELEPLCRSAAEAVWQHNATGEERWEQESARLVTAIRTALARPDDYALLDEATRSPNGADPFLVRQALLLRNEMAPNQIAPETIERIVRLETALEGAFNTFRSELDGEHVGENRIREILETSDDLDLRRRAWEASKQVGREVVDRLLELVDVRNAAAREIGFANYYSMSFELDELDEDDVFRTIDLVVEGSNDAYRRYKTRLDGELAARFGVPVDELGPWHYADPFFQEAPVVDLDLDRWFAGRRIDDLAAEFFTTVGFDVSRILARSDLYEREGKCQHAFCMDVDRKGDIRILCNLTETEYWASTMLHELGHGVYDEGIGHELPYFLRTAAHTITTEATAMLFGRLTRSGAWLARYAGMPVEEKATVASRLERSRVAQQLHAARWVPVMAYFERELYRDPSQDLNGLWWDLVERLQLVGRPDNRRATGAQYADWAAKIHFSSSPAYYQNYLFGEIVASQLQAQLLDLTGSWEGYVESPEVARYLVERLFRLGRSVLWQDAIAHATGRGVDVRPFLEEVAAT
jgi:peptidyl-dipeptidase A